MQLDPWPARRFGVVHETDRRITRVLSYLRDYPADNGYTRPVEGVVVFVDLATTEVLEVEDHGVVPVPIDKGSYFPADNGPVRTGLRPIDIMQPEGPSFTVDGNARHVAAVVVAVSASRRARGSSSTTVGYDDGGRVRARPPPGRRPRDGGPVRRSRPDAGPPRTPFDIGDGASAGPWPTRSTLGCDCLGEIRYLDATCSPTSTAIRRDPQRDLPPRGGLRHPLEAHRLAGRRQPRCGGSRRCVVSSDPTVGNYEYGFYWYFYHDGSIAVRSEADGDHPDDARSSRPAASRARRRHRAAAHRAVPPAPVLHAARHGRRRCREPDRTRSNIVAAAAATSNPHGNAFQAEHDRC